MKHRKLDRRFSGYKDFKYCVNFSNKELDKFCEIRNWCWEQWGASSELDTWYKIALKNPAWCWQYDQWNTRLYFASDAECQWYLLKWM